MNELKEKVALVTGGSRGFGLGIAQALAEQGANVWALARDGEELAGVRKSNGSIQTMVADVTDPLVPAQALQSIKPDLLVLNAGATPIMAPVYRQSWDEFSTNWNTDVFHTFAFGKQALLQPLAPGSVVVVVSSGAAMAGSPLSGSYAGAKRMQMFLTGYLQSEAKALGLDIRFVSLIPRQISGSTALGRAATQAYAAQQGMSEEAFLARSGAPLTPQIVGQSVVELLTNSVNDQVASFGVSGKGLAALDAA